MSRGQKKNLEEGHLRTEVEVEVTGEDEPWGPYLSIDVAKELDRIRAALRDSKAKTSEELENLRETLEILSDESSVRRLERAEREIARGETYPLEAVRAEIEDDAANCRSGS